VDQEGNQEGNQTAARDSDRECNNGKDSMQLTLAEDETEHDLQDIVISFAGFLIAGHPVENVEEEVLEALERALFLELESRKGIIH